MTDKWKEAQRVQALQSRTQELDMPELAMLDDSMGLEDKARVYEDLALETLAQVAYSTASSDNARVAASNAILDRSRGKPMQETRISVDDTKFKAMLEDMKRIRDGVYINDIKVLDAVVIDD